MVQIIFKPELHRFDTCKEFATAFNLGKSDLILTNSYIYTPYFGALNLPVKTIFQEEYGAGEPTDIMVDSIIQDAAKADCDRIIAIGGGTVIDIAKVLAVAVDEGVDSLYADMGSLQKKRKLVIVPTTCGTGSEVTNISIINRTRMETKMGLVSPNMFADQAVLVPQLLESLPYAVFATSSIDALVHAVESTLSPKATDYTKLFGYKAIEMILRDYKIIAEKGRQALTPLLGNFLIASNYAGLAFGTAGCGPVHAMSYPFGGQYHVAHGESNYVIFTGVLKYYFSLKQDGEIAELNRFMADLLGCGTEGVYEALDALLNNVFLKKSLSEYGVKEGELMDFARSVIDNQQRLMANSFVPLSYDEVLDIFKTLY